MLLNRFTRVPPFRVEFLVAKKSLPDRVHPFQLLKPILDRCDSMDKVTSAERSRIMARVKSSGNKSTEVLFLEILKKERISGWRRGYPLLGKPDLVFPHSKIVIFLDGCFWHGCPHHCRIPTANQEYWISKISRNRKRDKRIVTSLRKKGWLVIRIWEHEIKEKKGTRKLNILKSYLEANSHRIMK